ncbi:MAG: transglutaminase-like domain-containing protein [Myxococcota bacterium]
MEGNPREALQRLIDDYGDDVPLDQGAALIAAEEHRADVRDVLRQLDALADGARVSGQTSPFHAIARINHHLFEELGFQGDDEEYDRPENSFIDRVIARRRGLPILLSVIYVEVARRVGVALVGVSFPSHFIIRPVDSDAFFIDPFHQGRVLKPAHLEMWLSQLYRGAPITSDLWAKATQDASNREVLARMNRNLKFSYLRRKDLHGGIRASERILMLDPEQAEERRDLGRMLLSAGREEDGQAELAHYLALRPAAPDAFKIAAELEFLKRER